MALTKYSSPSRPGTNGAPAIASSVRMNRTAPLGTGQGNVTAQTQLSWILDNSAGGATALYIIGDATGMVATTDGRTLVSPTSNNTSFTVAQQKANFQVRPVLVSYLNLETSSTAAQFAQGLQLARVTQYGGYRRDRLTIGGFISPSDYNPLVRPVNVGNLDEPIVLSDYAALIIPVIAGEIVTVYANVSEQIVGR